MARKPYIDSRVQGLSHRFDEMDTRIRQWLSDCAVAGRIPPDDVIHELGDLRKSFLDIRQQLLAESLQEDVPPGADEESADSLCKLDDIASRTTGIRENRAKRGVQAAALLDAVLSIVHCEGADIPALAACQHQARELKAKLAAGLSPATELDALAGGTHVLCDLLALIRGAESLHDDEWESLRDRVTDGLGRALAVAAGRGRLRIPKGEPAGQEPAETESQILDRSREVPGDSPPKSEHVDATSTGANTGQPSASAAASPVGLIDESAPADQMNKKVQDDSSEIVASGEQVTTPTKPECDTRVVVSLAEHAAEPSSICEAAATSRGDGIADHQPLLHDLVCKLITEDRLGLAFHLSRCARKIKGSDCGLIEPVLLRALAIAPVVRSSYDDAFDCLRSDISDLHLYLPKATDRASDVDYSTCLLMFALVLQPALLAPTTGASELMRALPLARALGGLKRLRSTILEYVQLGIELTPGILKGVHEHTVWETQLEDLRTVCHKWLTEKRHKSIVYAPATRVWQACLKPEAHLGRMLEAIVRSPRGDLTEISKLHSELNSPAGLRDWLIRMDRGVRGREAYLRPIEARAMQALIKFGHEAVDLAARWIQLRQNEPKAGDARYRLTDRHRSQAVAAVHEALEDLKGVSVAAGSSPLAICARHCVTASLGRLEDLFNPSPASGKPLLGYPHLLNVELLRLPGLQLNSSWDVSEGDVTPQLLERLAELSRTGPADWRSVFEAQCRARNHVATERLLTVVEQLEGKDPQDLRQEREQMLQACRELLSQSLDQAEKAIETATIQGVIGEQKRLEMANVAADLRSAQLLDFQMADHKLENDVLTPVRQAREAAQQEIGRRLEEAKLSQQNPKAYRRIQSLLQVNDFTTSLEYIRQVESGQELPPEEQRPGCFEEYFPSFVRQFIESKGGADAHNFDGRRLVEDVANGRTAGPLVTGHLPKERAKEAAAMLKAWFKLKRRDNVNSELQSLLTGLGFRLEKNPTLTQANRGLRAEIQVSTIKDQTICVIPQFGSMAAGRYTVLCLWDRPSPDEIIQQAAAQASAGVTIIVYLGRMSEQDRRYLAEQTHCRHTRPILVIDETLVCFLCGRRESRLPAMLECTFPFTPVNPYTTTAGLVPEEMFFGRSQERDSVFDRQGTNLVYGGRQLGKTALLRDVERRYNDPGKGIIVKWIDIREIGINRPLEDVWQLLASALQEHDVITKASQIGVDRLTQHVQDWLRSGPERRIVLLLDEADRFLQGDAGSWIHLGRLKTLMDVTDRRFKVVLAGLHNVQRTSRDSNSPLAHLGQPICIGPLLDNGEGQEALNLIVRPFRSLGYRFELADLPVRILSLTNYYPSLIQLFCNELLSHLANRNQRMFDPKTSPPYVITRQHLDDAYNSKSLRSAILDRFTWTLNLDLRYRVIALLIALECEGARSSGSLTRGLDVSWVRDQALDWWPQGFRQDSSLEVFRTILDEMIGLGILRKVDERRYALRSPNVLNLLGTKPEIEQALEETLTREPEPEYAAAEFHRALPDDPWARSPLTAQQESQLLAHSWGVAVLCGTRASGIDRLGQFLGNGIGQGVSVRELAQFREGAEFLRFLDTFHKDAKRQEGLTLFIVPPGCWTEAWVRDAALLLQRKTSKRHATRVLFLADATAAWSWATADSAACADVDVQEYSLRPWSDNALQQWINDTQLGHDDAASRERFRQVTGNWGGLLHLVGQRCRSQPHRWAETLAQFQAELSGAGKWEEFFGFVPQALSVLATMADYGGPLAEDDLKALLTREEGAAVQSILRWAELLCLARKEGQGLWGLSPLVESAIKMLKPRS